MSNHGAVQKPSSQFQVLVDDFIVVYDKSFPRNGEVSDYVGAIIKPEKPASIWRALDCRVGVAPGARCGWRKYISARLAWMRLLLLRSLYACILRGAFRSSFKGLASRVEGVGLGVVVSLRLDD